MMPFHNIINYGCANWDKCISEGRYCPIAEACPGTDANCKDFKLAYYDPNKKAKMRHITYSYDGERATVNGHFTAAELESIAVIMREKKEVHVKQWSGWMDENSNIYSNNCSHGMHVCSHCGEKIKGAE